MNIVLLTLIATLCNVGTIACIKKCKHAISVGQPVFVWVAGIAVSILATQFLLLWADVKGASLGLVVSVVIALVMITAAFVSVDGESGRLVLVSLKGVAKLEVVGYGLAVAGVLLVGVSQQQHSAKAITEPSLHRSAD